PVSSKRRSARSIGLSSKAARPPSTSPWGRSTPASSSPIPSAPTGGETVRRLREAGVENVALVTGDVRSTAEAVAASVGITTVHAETTPQTKVEIVGGLQPRPVLM